MNIALPAAITDGSYTAIGMCTAGIVLFLIALPRTIKEVGSARGLDKVVALTSMSIAVPLAIFGALHLFGPKFVMNLVPPYMPWRMFWVYGVGCALIAAAASIATGIGVRWSGVLLGVMMFGFVAMIHFPGWLRHPEMRRLWVIVCREMSFGGAGWLLAGLAWGPPKGNGRKVLIAVGRICVTIAIAFFGVQQILHPTVLPVVPLDKQMPESIPARAIIGYLTGAALVLTGASILLSRKTRIAAASLGAWIDALVLVLYAPLMIQALADPAIGVKLTGINFFADTLLFGGVVLALASTYATSSNAEPSTQDS